MYAVLKLRWKPSEFACLSDEEKAFVIACIDEQLEAEKKANREAKRRR